MNTSNKYVSVWLVRALLAYAASAHIDGNALIRLAGIAPDDLKDSGGKISIDRFCAFATALSDASGGELSGLRLADIIGSAYGRNHILMTIMVNCPTLEKAIGKLARYHDISSNYIKLLPRKIDRDAEFVVAAESGLPAELESIFLEAAVAACAVMIKGLTVGVDCMAWVCLTSPAPVEPDVYTRFFGCPVVFGSGENKIVFHAGALNAPLELSNPALLDVLEGYVWSKLTGETASCAVSGKLKSYMESMITRGKTFQIGDAAEGLGVSVRTLQKRLKREGAAYRALMEDAKRDIAVKSLKNPEDSLLDITFLLGFSEQSAFSRAFKRWTGQSPMKYRQRLSI